jgi:putative ABC transport system substrate-binding protein
MPSDVSLLLSMALLSSVDSTPRAYRLKAGNAASKVSTDAGTSPSNGAAPFSVAKRRTMLSGVAAALFSGELAERALAGNGMHRLGVLLVMPESYAQARMTALRQGLRGFDWQEGDNLHIDLRRAEDPALIERYATELVALDPDVILISSSSTAVKALRRKTSTIPIVFVLITDPVGQGFVESLAHPGGNITGFSNYNPEMVGKWLEMLTQISPPVARVAILYNPATAPYAGLYLHAIDNAARSLALTIQDAPVHDDAGIEAVMTALAREQRGGALLLPDIFTSGHQDAIIGFAARYRLPTVLTGRDFPREGWLMSYGIDPADLFRRAIDYVDRILRGAKPADLPVQQPSKFELVINLKTAKSLGVTVSPALLARADEVIE